MGVPILADTLLLGLCLVDVLGGVGVEFVELDPCSGRAFWASFHASWRFRASSSAFFLSSALRLALASCRLTSSGQTNFLYSNRAKAYIKAEGSSTAKKRKRGRKKWRPLVNRAAMNTFKPLLSDMPAVRTKRQMVFHTGMGVRCCC